MAVNDYVSYQAANASAKQQIAFQREMSNTAHQREVADLKAAGLNPVLSAGGTGASTPIGAEGYVGDAQAKAFDLANQIANTMASALEDVSHTSGRSIHRLVKTVSDQSEEVKDVLRGLRDIKLDATTGKGITRKDSALSVLDPVLLSAGSKGSLSNSPIIASSSTKRPDSIKRLDLVSNLAGLAGIKLPRAGSSFVYSTEEALLNGLARRQGYSNVWQQKRATDAKLAASYAAKGKKIPYFLKASLND